MAVFRFAQKAGAPWRYFALRFGDFVNALDQWHMMARAAGRRWLSVALVATRNEQASCLSTTHSTCWSWEAHAGPSRRKRGRGF